MIKIKPIIKAIVFLILGILIFQVLSMIFITKWVDRKDEGISYIKKGFYDEEKNTIDILFVGNSNVERSIAPILLYEKHGITSYNLVTPAQKMWSNYYIIKESLEYQNPKIIFLEVDSIFDEAKANEGFERQFFDSMKFDKVKVEAILDPVYEYNFTEKLSYFLPLIKYHSRWSELKYEDFKLAYFNYHHYNKGFYMSTTRQIPQNAKEEYLKKNNDKVNYKIGPKCEKYFNKIIELCNERQIKLILFSVPTTTSWSEMRSNVMEEYAEKSGITYIDLNKVIDDLELVWERDWYDSGHLNLYGAEKVTTYIGTLLERYSLVDHRKDEEYKQWNEDLDKFYNMRNTIEN